MDEDALDLLSAVNALCEGANWRILDETELSERLPHGRAENIAALLERLEARRFIEMRYAEGGTYCIRPLPAGRAYAARAREEAVSAAVREHRAFRTAFLGGLAGAFLGALFGALLAWLLSLPW